MPPEQRAQFVLKTHLMVMLFLVLNIGFHRLNIGLAHGKGRVATLPVKVHYSRSVDFHPLGTRFLHFLDDLLEGMILGKRKQRMNVVLDAANQQRWAFPFLEDSSLVGVQACTMV